MEDYRRDPLWLRLAFLEREASGRQMSLTRLVADALELDADASRRVVEEYRRFLFLLMRAGHAITPPPQIERVLQLHEQFSLNYWDILAEMIIERPFVGGGSNLTESYQRIFGEAPPADIWSAQTDASATLVRMCRRMAQFAARVIPR